MTPSVPDPIVLRAKRAPDAPALRAGVQRWSSARLLEQVRGLAQSLYDSGAGAGIRVACLLEDGAPAVTLIHAVRQLGAVLVPLNRRATAVELHDQLGRASVEILVTDGLNVAVARAAASGGFAVHDIDDLLRATPGVSATGEASATREPSLDDRSSALPLREDMALDEAATIVFTSGTTGRPKPAMLTHGNHAASADAWATVLQPAPSDRWLACLPLFHVAGLAIVSRASRWGAELEVQPGFEAGAVLDALRGGVTHLSLVSTQLQRLLDESAGHVVPGSLRAVLLGGGPIPTTLLTQARSIGFPVLTTYGMTETSSGIAVGGADEATLADPSALRPLPGAQLDVTPEGHLRVRGPMVFPGYIGASVGGQEAQADGWFETGDLGSIDAAGLLRIDHRRADLIISGGENVYPAEVEAVLRQHPDIGEVAVVGCPDPGWGMVPVAFVVPTEGSPVMVGDLAAHCRDRLARYKVPARFYEMAALPRDDLGKVRVVELLRMAEEWS